MHASTPLPRREPSVRLRLEEPLSRGGDGAEQLALGLQRLRARRSASSDAASWNLRIDDRPRRPPAPLAQARAARRPDMVESICTSPRLNQPASAYWLR